MTGTTGHPTIEAAFVLVSDQIRALPPHEVVSMCSRFKSILAGVEAEALAREVDASGNDARARNMLSKDTGSSKREKFKRAQRAKAAAKNPELVNKTRTGELSEEQLDVLADASDKSDGHAATDTELIKRISSANPDQGRGIAKQWLEDNADQDKINTEYERQRKLRFARKSINREGVPTLTLTGDQATIDAMFAQGKQTANELYKTDGGRDIPHAQHPRTEAQRSFDAFDILINGRGHAANQPGGSCSARRPAMVVGVPLDKVAGADPHAVAIQFGSGPIPDSVLQKYLRNSDLFFALTGPGANNVPLALFRTKRHASTNQFIALVFRDRGCVRCGAPPEHCQAHHLIPWNAPAKGETNLEDLALVCSSCHTELHANKLTLYWDAENDMWATRPATCAEIAPSRPNKPDRKRRSPA